MPDYLIAYLQPRICTSLTGSFKYQ